jgi:preprotein translocase subunit SecD
MKDEMLKDNKIRILLVFVAVSLFLIMGKGISTGLDLRGGSVIIIETERVLDAGEMDQVLTIMDERLRGGLGVRDVKVRALGDQHVRIEIAGVAPEDAKKLIGKPGKLEVRIGEVSAFTGDKLDRVDPFTYEARSGGWAVPFTLSDEAAEAFRDAAVAANFSRVYMYMDEGTKITAFTRDEPVGLKELLKELELPGDVEINRSNLTTKTVITLDNNLDEIGGKESQIIAHLNQSNITTYNITRTGLVNDAPLSPSLQAELGAGQTVISLILETGSGEDGRKEARRIDAILRSGALEIYFRVV